jgi:hypothetical protein
MTKRIPIIFQKVDEVVKYAVWNEQENGDYEREVLFERDIDETRYETGQS